ncbi:glutamate racemase [Candidatus Woesebacteria bacterium]|nr:glutamate racemase [Candidatus Woesebacteria bacterium]
MNRKPIGIFDSGLGGLSVLKKIQQQLPGEDIVYLGDTARVPYGTRSKKTIERFSIQCARFLVDKGVKCIVIACNTSSSNALEIIKKQTSLPIFDVVNSSIEALKELKSVKNIGVIGTSATVNSHIHRKLINFRKFKIVFEIPCPLFVPLVENGEIESKITDLVAHKYLSKKRDKVQAVIMACTHFPIIKKSIKKALGEKVTLIDPAEKLSLSLKEYLLKNNFESDRNNGKLTFYVTDISSTFKDTASVFLGKHSQLKIRKTSLDN